ncbi:uncharacterized protein LOC133886295 [Phragmites australis]|uniref:uncharacterized protein LOC133886295 n=1 Tax=Phragmites australis TaxID=29695 RepID=UPI002D789F71|nr:uncharacterized protein LOC133886295 [Phragmites australis]
MAAAAASLSSPSTSLLSIPIPPTRLFSRNPKPNQAPLRSQLLLRLPLSSGSRVWHVPLLAAWSASASTKYLAQHPSRSLQLPAEKSTLCASSTFLRRTLAPSASCSVSRNLIPTPPSPEAPYSIPLLELHRSAHQFAPTAPSPGSSKIHSPSSSSTASIPHRWRHISSSPPPPQAPKSIPPPRAPPIRFYPCSIRSPSPKLRTPIPLLELHGSASILHRLSHIGSSLSARPPTRRRRPLRVPKRGSFLSHCTTAYSYTESQEKKTFELLQSSSVTSNWDTALFITRYIWIIERIYKFSQRRSNTRHSI